MSPAESFMKDDIQKLLFNKFIVVIGDSGWYLILIKI